MHKYALRPRLYGITHGMSLSDSKIYLKEFEEDDRFLTQTFNYDKIHRLWLIDPMYMHGVSMLKFSQAELIKEKAPKFFDIAFKSLESYKIDEVI